MALRTKIAVGFAAVFAPFLVTSALAQEGDLEVYEFPQGPISGEHLSLTSATVSQDQPVEIRFRDVARTGRTLIATFLPRYRGPWEIAHRREFRDQSSGTWVTSFEETGEYLVCTASEANADGVYPPAGPQLFDECVRVFAVRGPASYNPRPRIEILTDRVYAGEAFTIRYSGMPEFDGARIEVVRWGLPNYTISPPPPVRHPTRGASQGQIRAVLPERGKYEIRIMYDNNGRQVRARQVISVEPRQ